MTKCVCGHDTERHGFSGCLVHEPLATHFYCPCELPWGVAPADGTKQPWAYPAPAYLAPDLSIFAHLAAAVRNAWDQNPSVARFALLELD